MQWRGYPGVWGSLHERVRLKWSRCLGHKAVVYTAGKGIKVVLILPSMVYATGTQSARKGYKKGPQ